MLPPDPERELERLHKKTLWLSVADAPGLVLIALALFGKSSGGKAFYAPLNNPNVTTAMLVLGIVIVAWATIQLLSAVMERVRIQRELDDRDS